MSTYASGGFIVAERAVQLLMREAPRGQPLDPAMLRNLGISPAQTHYLVTAGWLQRLSKGAYLLRGDVPTMEGILMYLRADTLRGSMLVERLRSTGRGYATTLRSGRE